MGLSPVRPSDTSAIVPSPTSDACTVLSNFVTGLRLFDDLVTWMVNEDGTLTTDFLEAVGTTGGGTTGLAAPQNVTATDTLTTKITVQWSSVGGATSYNVYRSTTNDAASMTVPIATVTSGTSYDDVPPSQDTTYWYAVRAYSGTQISGLSDITSGIRLTEEAPATKTINFTYSANLQTLTIPAGYTSMELYVAAGGGRNGGNKVCANILQGECVRAYGPTYYPGGGGGSGAVYHVEAITVAEGDVFKIRVGRKTSTQTGESTVWKDDEGNANYVTASAGQDGQSGNTTRAGTAGLGGTPAGEATMGTPNVDSVAGDDGSGTTGGAAVTLAGVSSGAGAAGTNDYNVEDGAPGYVRVILT